MFNVCLELDKHLSQSLRFECMQFLCSEKKEGGGVLVLAGYRVSVTMNYNLLFGDQTIYGTLNLFLI